MAARFQIVVDAHAPLLVADFWRNAEGSWLVLQYPEGNEF